MGWKSIEVKDITDIPAKDGEYFCYSFEIWESELRAFQAVRAKSRLFIQLWLHLRQQNNRNCKSTGPAFMKAHVGFNLRRILIFRARCIGKFVMKGVMTKL
jgi:hypothetical protein